MDTAKVLEAYGHGPFDGGQLVELSQHLWHFLHGRVERCYGKTAAAAGPAMAPAQSPEEPADDEAPAGIDRAMAAGRALSRPGSSRHLMPHESSGLP